MLSRHIKQEVCPWNSPKLVQVAGEEDYRARPAFEVRSSTVEVRNAGEGQAPVQGRFRSGAGSLPGTEAPSLIELLEMALNEAAWDEFSRGSAIRRAGRAGFARNVCVGLGNWGSLDVVPVLTSALSDPEPMVRVHAAWALGRVGSAEARAALTARAAVESDDAVRADLASALAS